MNQIVRETDSRERRSLGMQVSVLIILICLAVDYLLMPVMSMVPRDPGLVYPLLMASVGCVLAQVCLLAAWLVWSEQAIGRRLVRHWIVAAILYLVWTAGLAFGLPDQFILASSVVGLSIPLVSIAVQLPLWFTRQVLGWRFIREDMNDVTDEAPLTIRDLMLATVLFALALATACSVPSPDGKEMTTPLLIVFVAASAVSTITLIPAGPLLLRTRHFELGVFGACLYAACWMTLPWLVIFVARSRGVFAAPPLPVLVGLSCLVLSFAATVILTATAARVFGYRLHMGRQQGRSSASNAH